MPHIIKLFFLSALQRCPLSLTRLSRKGEKQGTGSRNLPRKEALRVSMLLLAAAAGAHARPKAHAVPTTLSPSDRSRPIGPWDIMPQDLTPPGSEGALSSGLFMNTRQLAFNRSACNAILEGTSGHNFEQGQSAITSDREIVFNLGSYKTGSTSLNEALDSLGFHACKTAWNDLGGQYASFDMASIAAFAASPTSGDSPLHKAVATCTALGDAPWLFLFPTLMRAFPKAKFILTRQPTCEDWVYHVRGLWQWMGWLGEEQKWTTPLGKKYGIAGELNTCWYGSWAPDATKLWHNRCVETERAIVMTARALGRPLLVLPATLSDQEKWAALDQFLGTNSTAMKGGQPDYPYRSTGELHGPNEEPPHDTVDDNAHLWAEKLMVPNVADRPKALRPELAAQTQCTAISVGRLASVSGIALWCYELATNHESCDKLHLTLGSRGYAKCVWRGEECTAEAVIQGFPPCAEVAVDEYLAVSSGLSQSRLLVTPPLALGVQASADFFSVPTKDIWNMYQCPDGANSVKAHQSWLTGLVDTPEFDAYLTRVYGQRVSNVTATSLSYFWDTVPRRAGVKVWWAAWFCSKNKPATQPPGQLWAPLEDAISSPESVHVADFKSCEALARAQNLRWNSAPSLDSSTHVQEACDAALCALGMIEVPQSRCKLSHELIQCANTTAGRGGDDFSFRSCVAQSARTRAPTSLVYFPGFFVRYSADFWIQATRRLMLAPPLVSANDKVGDTGVPDHTWVEVVRVGRLDDKNDEADRATVGQVWFWLAPGSGVWWNTGTTLVISDSNAGSGAGCTAAHKQGYDSIQLTRRGPTPTHPYSFEIVDCRLQGRAEANMTWASACPPPGLELRSGMPAEKERFAPALEGKRLRADMRGCHCDSQYSYLNCARV